MELRGGSRAAATSKMKLFMIIVNGLQSLAIITKCSILDVAAVLGPPLKLLDVSQNGLFESSLYQFESN